MFLKLFFKLKLYFIKFPFLKKVLCIQIHYIREIHTIQNFYCEKDHKLRLEATIKPCPVSYMYRISLLLMNDGFMLSILKRKYFCWTTSHWIILLFMRIQKFFSDTVCNFRIFKCTFLSILIMEERKFSFNNNNSFYWYLMH